MQGERIHTEIEAAADELVTSGAETGLQVAVVKDGQVVADVARGSALLGQVGGVELVSPGRLAAMAAVAFTGMDQVMGFPVRWAFGYSPGRPGTAASRPGSTFGMVGANGSAAYADIDSGVAVAVMRNRFTVGDLSTAARIDGIVAGTLT
jgi:CubicO group peptidase (beta-lactamase class C family)